MRRDAACSYCHAGQNNDQWRCEGVGSIERLAVVKGDIQTFAIVRGEQKVATFSSLFLLTHMQTHP